MTKIIATIGPASCQEESLQYFADNNVEFARLNFSHNTPDWHNKIGKIARDKGLKLMLDTAGPKVLLGDLSHSIEIDKNSNIIIEKQIAEKTYPIWHDPEKHQLVTLPCLFDMTKFITVGKTVLIDDGKVELVVEKIEGKRVYCKVKSGGAIKSHKGVNLPGTELKIDFLVDRDKSMLQGTLTYLKPEYIAVSFVKTRQDLLRFKEYVSELLEKDGIKDYYPKICTKIEMSEAISEENFDSVLNESDMIMIARGDLALETTPMHVSIPFIQEKIIQACRAKDKPFVVATQILESMMESAVPTRAEVSDLYRAVVLNKADYIMLSGESAAGKYPKKCIDIMNGLINFNQSQLQA